MLPGSLAGRMMWRERAGPDAFIGLKKTSKSHKQTQEIKYFIRLKKSGGDDLNWVYRHLRGLGWRTDLLDL